MKGGGLSGTRRVSDTRARSVTGTYAGPYERVDWVSVPRVTQLLEQGRV